MKIKSFSPTADWFFVFTDTQGKKVNYRLAGFAVVEDASLGADAVIGMVPVTDESPASRYAQLAPVPPVVGTYKHAADMSE